MTKMTMPTDKTNMKKLVLGDKVSIAKSHPNYAVDHDLKLMSL
jgi:hypothetical protein